MSELQALVGNVNLSTQEWKLPEDFLACNNENYAICYFGDILIKENLAAPNDVLSLYEASANIDDFYQNVSGKFGLMVTDIKQKTTYLVNDQLGMQTVYYSKQALNLFWSCSLKQLKKQSPTAFTLSKQAIFNYIYFHCIPSPTTIYQEAEKLEPGKVIIFDCNGQVSTKNLYSPTFTSKSGDLAQLEKDCLKTIEQAVSVSITENCGAFLSGGLDSSTVAGMLAKNTTEAKTFSIGFEAEGYDETEYALLTSKHFNTKHEVLYLKSEQAADEFLKVAQYFDEPFGNSSAMAAYFCAKFAKDQGVTTLLGGDGGDEIFAGNDRYAKQKTFELWGNTPSIIRSIVKPINGLLSSLPIFSKADSYIKQAEMPLPERLQSYNFVNQIGMNEIFSAEFLEDIDQQLPIKQLQARYFDCKSEDPVDRMLYLDWKFTLADNDLVKVNKMCELAGVTVKYPLLEKSVVDFSCKISAEDKLPGSKLRHFFKQACKGFLADGTLTKSKHGFGLPFGVWLKENEKLNTLAFDALKAFKQRKIVNDSLVDSAIEAHSNVHASYYGELIWILVVLELWLQHEEEN
jgi:asparagine synthase (glutamine-hydrolysing)